MEVVEGFFWYFHCICSSEKFLFSIQMFGEGNLTENWKRFSVPLRMGVMNWSPVARVSCGITCPIKMIPVGAELCPGEIIMQPVQ